MPYNLVCDINNNNSNNNIEIIFKEEVGICYFICASIGIVKQW